MTRESDHLRRLLPPHRYAAWQRGERGPVPWPADAPPPAIPATPERKLVEPQHPSEWPLIVKVVARLRREGEKGVGDTLARLFNALPAYRGMGAGDAFKAFFAKRGIDCGCCSRQRWANQRYRYPTHGHEPTEGAEGADRRANEAASIDS